MEEGPFKRLGWFQVNDDWKSSHIRRFFGLSKKPNQKLSYDEEKELEKALVKLRKRGYRVTRSVIRKKAIELFASKSKKLFTYHWAAHWATRYGFVRRKATRRRKVWKLHEWNQCGTTFQDECAQVIDEFSLKEDSVENADKMRVIFGTLWLFELTF